MQRSTSCTTNLKPNFENQTALVFGQRSTKYGTIPEYLVETKIWGIGVWNYADILPAIVWTRASKSSGTYAGISADSTWSGLCAWSTLAASQASVVTAESPEYLRSKIYINMYYKGLRNRLEYSCSILWRYPARV